MPGEDEPKVGTVQQPVVLGTAVGLDGTDFITCQLGDGNPHIMHVGDRIGEYTIKTIERARVVFTTVHGEKLEVAPLKTGADACRSLLESAFVAACTAAVTLPPQAQRGGRGARQQPPPVQTDSSAHPREKRHDESAAQNGQRHRLCSGLSGSGPARGALGGGRGRGGLNVAMANIPTKRVTPRIERSGSPRLLMLEVLRGLVAQNDPADYRGHIAHSRWRERCSPRPSNNMVQQLPDTAS